MNSRSRKLGISTLWMLLLLLFAFGTAKPVHATTKSPAEAIAWCESKVGQTKTIGSGECVALISAYYQYLGVSAVSGNACDYTSNSLPAGWQRLQGASPQRGDIMVWTSSGTYGHVCIYDNDYSLYHQNYSGRYVRRITNYWRGSGYSRHTYWGCIRPNWNGSSASTTSTYYVSGTQSGALAINSIASSGYEIDCIPEGAPFTVDLSRTSGNWYWVTYYGTSGYSWSPLMTTSTPYNSPQGSVESVSAGTGTVSVSGWAFDRDIARNALEIQVYIGGAYAGSLTANQTRTDVGNAYLGVQSNHGFSGTITTSLSGSQTVVVYAINGGSTGQTVELGRSTVYITAKAPVVYTYSITYTLQGGTATNPSKYTNATTTFTLKNPTRKGYTFTGWTGTGLSSKTKTVTIKKGSKGNRTYTANWTRTLVKTKKLYKMTENKVVNVFDVTGDGKGDTVYYKNGKGEATVKINGKAYYVTCARGVTAMYILRFNNANTFFLVNYGQYGGSSIGIYRYYNKSLRSAGSDLYSPLGWSLVWKLSNSILYTVGTDSKMFRYDIFNANTTKGLSCVMKFKLDSVHHKLKLVQNYFPAKRLQTYRYTGKATRLSTYATKSNGLGPVLKYGSYATLVGIYAKGNIFRARFKVGNAMGYYFGSSRLAFK